ncbi:MAG: TolC family protein [Gemmataceae bacterium]|nr:TolC family protein [Gemmataceae bacterium]
MVSQFRKWVERKKRLACSSAAMGFFILTNAAWCQPRDQPAPNQDALLRPTLLPPVPTAPRESEPIQSEAREILSASALVAEVLARNPNLSQMIAAFEAASARYPQVRALDDPMVGGMIAPRSFNSSRVDPGYRIEVSQKLPFPGKRQWKGQAALAEAGAAQGDVDDTRLQLIESTKIAFYDYFFIDRSLAVNGEGLRLLKEFKGNAETRYRTGQAPQQDVLQAEVELGRQRERQVLLERMRKVAIARINTLRSAEPNEPLPPPPQSLQPPFGLPSQDSLLALARGQRPDLRAVRHRIAVEQASFALALKEYYPDIEISAAYDTIMGNGQSNNLAPQAGIRMNVPLWQGKRSGAVAEARAKIAQKSAELQSKINQVNLQVAEAYEQLVESARVLELYAKSISPAAREGVKAAQTAYVTGKSPFTTLIEAQRSLVGVQDREYEATSDYFRRLATLERAVGGSLSVIESDRPKR